MSKKDKKKDKKKLKGNKIKNQNNGLVITDENLTLEQRIYSIPASDVTTFLHNRLVNLENAGLVKKYTNQYMIVRYSSGIQFLSPIETSRYVGIVDESIAEEYLSKNGVSIRARIDAEYNPIYLQYVGAVVIASPNHIAVLKSKKGRLKDKFTMVQGHVDYSYNFVTDTLPEFIRANAFRELAEEVKFNDGTEFDYSKMSEMPQFMIKKQDSIVDAEHIGFVYVYEMTDEEIVKLDTNEKDKHSVKILDRSTIQTDEEQKDKYDSWLGDVLMMI